MILAASGGHEDVVRLLLSYGVPPGIKFVHPTDARDVSSLSVAAKYGHLSLVKLFVSLGCNVHIGAWWGAGILVNAAAEGHYEVVRFLLETNPDLEKSPRQASSALRIAAIGGYIETVQLLLEHGTTPTPTMIGWRLRPLIEAAQREYYAVVDTLRNAMDLPAFIAHGEPDDDIHRELLLVSAACGWEDIIKELLDRGCSSDCPDPKNREWAMERKLQGSSYLSTRGYPLPLTLAAHRGHYGAFKLLLNHTIESDKSLLYRREPYPLLAAIDGSQKRIVSILLDHGVDPNHQIPPQNTPVFFEAVQVPEILELLLDRGADPRLNTKYGVEEVHCESVFMRALSTGSLSAANILQQRASFIEPRLGTDFYPFFEAATYGGAAMIEYLLDSGYKVVPGSPQVGRALHTILSRSDTSSLTILFERGLVGSLTTIDNKSLMGVVDSPSEDWDAVAATLDTLIVHGIDVEGGSYSPLHDVHTRMHNLSQLLLDRGADPLRTHTNLGITPLGQVARRGCISLVRMMLNALERRRVPFGELKEKLIEAEKQAELAQQDYLSGDVLPLLRRFYWRKKYQD